MEIPLPAVDERIRLVKLYARGIPFSEEAIQDAATRTEGTTASFARELVRRAVVGAAVEGISVGDGHLSAAVDGLMADGEALTRSLLGSGLDAGPANPGFGTPGMPGPGLRPGPPGAGRPSRAVSGIPPA